jgi:hypothetical protein
MKRVSGPDTDLLILQIKTLEDEFLSGNKKALLKALKLCTVQDNYIMPQWVASGVYQALISWERLEVRTLDDAFNVAKPKNFALKANREKQKIILSVWFAVGELHKKGRPLDEEIFELAGDEHGISSQTARNYYYEFHNYFEGKTDHPFYVF